MKHSQNLILVPSTGGSYLNNDLIKKERKNMHSRPLYGGLLSQYIKRNGDIQKHDSRPLYGGLLSQWKYDFESIRKLQFSSPLRGSLISIEEYKSMTQLIAFSSPLRGSLISINTNAINKIFGYTFSSPLRGSLISILSPTPPKTQGFYPPFAGQTRK